MIQGRGLTGQLGTCRGWDAGLCRCWAWLPTECATHGPDASLHSRSRPQPHPSAAGAQGEVTPDSPVFRHTHTSVHLCGAAAGRSLGISVRTLCWLPSLWGDCPPHLLSTSYLHLCPFLQGDIFSSPTDSSSTFLMVLMRTSKPIISGPASPRAPDLQPNLACLGALSSRPPSLDCSQMPTPKVFPPTCISHPLDLLLNIISSKTFPDHIIYSSLHTSQLLFTRPGHGDHHTALDLLRCWLISEAHTLCLAHLSIPGPTQTTGSGWMSEWLLHSTAQDRCSLNVDELSPLGTQGETTSPSSRVLYVQMSLHFPKVKPPRPLWYPSSFLRANNSSASPNFISLIALKV